MTEVIVYKNLRRGDWSVAALKGANGRGQKLASTDAVTLTNVRFYVSESARQTVVRKGERSVHAYCIGTMVAATAGSPKSPPTPNRKEVSYNPYRAGAFTTREGGVLVMRADRVEFASDGRCYAEGAR